MCKGAKKVRSRLLCAEIVHWHLLSRIIHLQQTAGRLSWTCSRRVVAKAEQLTAATADGASKSIPRFIVTSRVIRDVDARTLYEDVCRPRGEMESRIKEQQLMLFADRTSAAAMRANRLRFYCSSVAYVLFAALRRLGLAGNA